MHTANIAHGADTLLCLLRMVPASAVESVVAATLSAARLPSLSTAVVDADTVTLVKVGNSNRCPYGDSK